MCRAMQSRTRCWFGVRRSWLIRTNVRICGRDCKGHFCHFGESWNPPFVIPVKAGILPSSFRRRPESSLAFSLVFGAVAKTGSRPCVDRRPSMAAGSFLLLVQKKVTKEKTPSRPRSRAHPCARDYASRLRGSPGAHPCALVERARILRAPLRAVPAPARRGREGPGRSKSAAVPAAEAVRTVMADTTHPLSRLRERARVRASSWVPS